MKNIINDKSDFINLVYSEYESRGSRGSYNDYPERYDVSKCENCEYLMEKVYYQNHDHGYGEDWYARGMYCIRCGWWAAYDIANRPSWAQGNSAWRALLAKTTSNSSIVLDGLKIINTYKEKLENLKPLDFEILCKDVLSDFLNCDVSHVGKSHDQGIDLIIVHSEAGLIPVQIKTRINNKSEGVQAIREFRGAMVLKGFSKGVFVTRANKFSSEAIDASTPSDEHLVPQRITLLDCRKLIEIMQFNDRKRVPMPILGNSSAKEGIKIQMEKFFKDLNAQEQPFKFLD